MFIQIEISTHCNFTCFYCAGRDMAQEHMPLATFERILSDLPAGQHTVCLQGEGEPMVHPDFWAMVDQVRAKGHIPYTITNGSRIDPEKIAAAFPRIAVSLDTIDQAEADRIGRKKLPKVLQNIDRLLQQVGPNRLIITTVDYGQPLDDLRAYVRSKGILDHMVQPLQVKEDYRKRYPDLPAPVERYTYRCCYLEQPLHRTYALDGNVFPCCYIKDPSGFTSADGLRASLLRQEVPQCCRGCREILVDTKQPYWISNAGAQAPLMSFVVPVKSRLAQLKESLPTLVGQPGCEVVVVDYDCPEQSGEWATTEFPGVRVVKVADAPVLNISRARNIGAAHASGQWLCFLDADAALPMHFLQSASPLLIPGNFSLFSRETPGLIICHRDDFRQIGGYDEIFEGWGCEDNDLIARLQQTGRQGQILPGDLYSLTKHDDSKRTGHYLIADKWLSLRINGMYFQIKTDIARALGIVSLPPHELHQIYAEVKRVILNSPATVAEIRINLPAQTQFQEPPNWNLKREWIYRFEPSMAPPTMNS